MNSNLRGRFRLRVPAIAWRDARLAERARQVQELRGRITLLEADLSAAREALAIYRGDLGEDLIPPSFRRSLMAARQTTPLVRSLDHRRQHPFRQIPFKLRNYRLGASHGVAVPEVFAQWSTVEDIDLSGLPDSFVVKSDRGAGSHGVLPLGRVGTDRYRLVGTTRELTTEDVKAHLAGKRSLGDPFFAEELLVQEDLGPELLPDDVKVYAFYGRIGHVLLRRPAEHGRLSTMAYRYVDEDGNDLGRTIAHRQRIDPGIPLPAGFSRILEIARHLSSAIPLPFIRVDVYDTVHGPVLGELTRTPGGLQLYRADHDRQLGQMWDEARIRAEVDIQGGRPPYILHGSVPTENPYPPDHISHGDTRAWAVHHAPCDRWCQVTG